MRGSGRCAQTKDRREGIKMFVTTWCNGKHGWTVNPAGIRFESF